MTAIYENGTVPLIAFGYQQSGRRGGFTRSTIAGGTSYGYDGAGRLVGLLHDVAGAADDLTLGFAYNPAGQIVSRTTSNDAYAWTGHRNATVSDSVNGLNQITQTGSTSVTHDARGNTIAIGGATYAYNYKNQLAVGGSGGFLYDPAGRLIYMSQAGIYFDYDGGAMIAESDAGTGAILKRFVHGPGVDEVLVEYSGPGLATKRWLHADERGSIVALSDAAGNLTAVNRYDEYGQPQGALAGRFGYTGQAWLPEIGLSYYKARMYNPALGRFMQSDPIGYGDGMNLYDYVSGDPVNGTDPSGTCVRRSMSRICVQPSISEESSSGGTPTSGAGGNGGGRSGGNGTPGQSSGGIFSPDGGWNPVVTIGFEFEAVLGSGVVVDAGIYLDRANSDLGFYGSIGNAWGVDLSASLTIGFFDDVAALNGSFTSFFGGLSAIGGEKVYNSEGRAVGHTGSYAIASPLPVSGRVITVGHGATVSIVPRSGPTAPRPASPAATAAEWMQRPTGPLNHGYINNWPTYKGCRGILCK